MDKILMRDLVFYGYHGVLEEEKSLGQKFIIDIELFLDLQNAGASDQVMDTVSYAEVYADVQKIVERQCFNLIEALAESLAQSILNKYLLVREVQIIVKKPQAPVAGLFDYFGVEIRRKKHG